MYYDKFMLIIVVIIIMMIMVVVMIIVVVIIMIAMIVATAPGRVPHLAGAGLVPGAGERAAPRRHGEARRPG